MALFPIGDDNSTRRSFPLVTLLLILANVVFFVAELGLGEAFIVQWSFVPRRFLADPTGDLATLFTSMFMHAGWLHIAGNLLYLWIFGDNVEDRMGHGRYLFFYLLCGIAAALSQFVVGPGARVPMIGASGAISGVIGAYLLLYPQARILTFVPIFILFYLVEIPAYFFIGFWFFLQFLQGTAQFAVGRLAEGGIAFWAHIGGFLGGVFLVQFFKRRREGGRRGQVWL